jgi:hypothetical protein
MWKISGKKVDGKLAGNPLNSFLKPGAKESGFQGPGRLPEREKFQSTLFVNTLFYSKNKYSRL